jgi:hypothetical protein
MAKKVSEMTQKEIIDLARNLFMGFTGDTHTPLDKFAEDGVFVDVTRPVVKEFKGKKAIGEFLVAYAGMSGWELEIIHEAGNGNVVGFEWIWRSVHDLGLYDGIPPRGIKTAIQGSSWITLTEDGKIAREIDIWNKEHLMHQLNKE